MSAHTLASTVDTSLALGGIKVALITVTLTASYNTNGSTLDLSSIFPSKCYGLMQSSVAPHGSAKYHASYVPAALYDAATGKVKILDVTTDPGAEVSSTTDLSATTMVFMAVGL
jgi:hypothetical protein